MRTPPVILSEEDKGRTRSYSAAYAEECIAAAQEEFPDYCARSGASPLNVNSMTDWATKRELVRAATGRGDI